jgi:hypothetical protein
LQQGASFHARLRGGRRADIAVAKDYATPRRGLRLGSTQSVVHATGAAHWSAGSAPVGLVRTEPQRWQRAIAERRVVLDAA